MINPAASPPALAIPSEAHDRGPRRLVIELIATSKSRSSVSARLLDRIRIELEAKDVSVGWTDRRDLGDADAGQDELPADYLALKCRVQAADAVVFAHGVHGFSVPGPTKTLTDILSSELVAKPFAVVTAAGSTRSHLAVRDLACSIVLENKSPWIPLTVQVVPDPANPDVDLIDNPSTEARVREFVDGVIHYAGRLAGLTDAQWVRS